MFYKSKTHIKICFILYYIMVLTLSACTNESDGGPKLCTYQSGIYDPSYEQVDGTCALFSPYPVNLPTITDPDRAHESQDSLMAGMILVTKISYKNCTLVMERNLMTEGKLKYTLKGSFQIDSATALSGEIDRTEYNEDGSVACTGKYQAILSLKQ